MSTPTKADWAIIEKKLDQIFRPVYLLCDGYYVRYELTRMKNRLVIGTYVNGYIKGEWFDTDEKMSEEARRFCRLSVHAKHKPKELKMWEKILGKRECKKRDMYGKYVFPNPVWNRPRPLINHLIKHNENIEIIDYETHNNAIKGMKDD